MKHFAVALRTFTCMPNFTGKTPFRSGTYSEKISITNSEFHLPIGSILMKGSGLRVQYLTLTNSLNHGHPSGSKGSYHDTVLNSVIVILKESPQN